MEQRHWYTRSYVPEGYSKSLESLELLRSRILEEISSYEQYAMDRGDDGRLIRARNTREWINSQGNDILRALRRKIAAADMSTQEAMAKALQAAVRSADLAAMRDMSDVSNRDMLWQWADQILCSLESAFSRYPEPIQVGALSEDAHRLEDVSPDWQECDSVYRFPTEPLSKGPNIPSAA